MTMRLSNDYWNEAKSQRGLTEKSDMTGYWNSIDPKETREIIQNERDCFHSRAQAALDDEAGGRFAKVTSNKLTGAGGVSYPAIPSGPYSHGDPGAPDPVTDQFGDVNEMEPTGSPTEIQRSLQRRDVNGASSPPVEHASESPTKDGIAVGPQGRDRHSAAISPRPFRRRF
jgi:hypothetical protein